MKNFAFFAFITLFTVILSGCAQRNSVLNLAPYQSTSNQAGYQKNIRINSVEDARANKSIVATITGGNGNVKEYVTLQNSIEGWLQDGLSTELKRLGANLSDFGDVVVDVRIVELKANLSGYSTDNLKGSAKLALCEEFGLDFDLPTLLFVGSGFKRKGAEEFLRIAARLKTRVNCLIVGRDKNAARYKNLAKELGLNAVFTGAQKSTARFYEGSELFLFPTAYEPFSNVVLEALSYGCVAITTAQNGAAEILPEEFVMRSPQDYDICALIDEILNDDERLAMLQERNLALASEFGIEKNASATLEIIRANLD